MVENQHLSMAVEWLEIVEDPENAWAHLPWFYSKQNQEQEVLPWAKGAYLNIGQHVRL